MTTRHFTLTNELELAEVGRKQWNLMRAEYHKRGEVESVKYARARVHFFKSEIVRIQNELRELGLCGSATR